MADPTTNALLAESKCLVCYPDSVQLEMQTYIIAYAAGVGMDPIQLAKDAKCFTCLNPLTLMEAKLYLLARIAQIGTDPVDLLQGTECYECIPQGVLTSVETNDLLNDPASPSTDAATIARLSRCFGCLSGQTLLEVQVYLLALLANVTPTPEEVERVTPPIDRIPPGRIRSAIVRQQGRIRNGGGLIPTHCTDVPADLIPILSAPVYTAGLLSSFTITVPKVCCRPHHLNLYQADDATGTNANNFASILISNSHAAEVNYVVAGTIGIALTQPYVLVTQVCNDMSESAYSNALDAVEPTCAAGQIVAEDWGDRVETNGGARPSQATIDAAARFYCSLITAGIDGKMLAVNIFAPDNLTACITPLIKTAGSDPWLNNNFVAGNLSTNGLLGNGSNQKLGVGINVNTQFGAAPNDIGLSMYASTNGSTPMNMGAYVSDASHLLLSPSYWDCYDNTTGRVSHLTAKPGFYSGNRIASNNSKCFFASGSSAFAQVGATATGAPGALPNAVIGVFDFNGGSYSSQVCSFAAIHLGLTPTEAEALYNAVQTLRTSMGGGYIPSLSNASQMATTWSSRVVGYGGAAPAAGSVSAVQTFWQALVDASIQDKFKVVGVFAPDNITAAVTPVFHIVGEGVFTNTNFVGGDLTVNGLKGNASNKYLNLRFTPAATGMFSSIGSNGLTAYIYDRGTEGALDLFMGAQVGSCATNGFELFPEAGGNTYWDSLLCVAGRISYAQTGFNGFFSGSRTTTSRSDLYIANSVTPIASVANTTANIAGQTYPNVTFTAFALNQSPSIIGYTNKRASFLAIHDGLNATQTEALYDAVQALRTAFGGGYI